jgi:hypothetical protein
VPDGKMIGWREMDVHTSGDVISPYRASHVGSRPSC